MRGRYTRARFGEVALAIDRLGLDALDEARRGFIASHVAKAFGREPVLAPYRMGSAFLITPSLGRGQGEGP